MTKEQKLINVQKQFTNPNAYKTYEQFVSEEVNLTNQQDLYPDLGYGDVGLNKGYGPCDTCRKDTQWASLYISCPVDDCKSGDVSSWYHSSGLNASDQSGCGSLLVSNKGDIKCDKCGTSSAIKNWKFKCSKHDGGYKSISNSSFKKSLVVANPNEMITDLCVYLSKH